MGSTFHEFVPKIQWDSNPHCPYSYKAMGNLYLFLTFIIKFRGKAKITKWTCQNLGNMTENVTMTTMKYDLFLMNENIT